MGLVAFRFNNPLIVFANRRKFLLAVVLLAVCFLWLGKSQAQNSESANGGQDRASEQRLPMLPIDEFKPRSMLNVASNNLKRAKYPVIDIHTHFGFRLKGDIEALNQFVDVMNRHQIAICTSLDARLGEETTHIEYLKKEYPNRFIVFAHIDWKGAGDQDNPGTWACNHPGFVRKVCEQIRRAKQNGIVGIKFFKQFGLQYRNADNKLFRIDNEMFDPIWDTCGELELPVIIHTGDPAAFFEPIDASNERYEELSRHPEWSFYGDEFPSRNELLAARNNVIRKHPNTKFIGAHMAGNPEDLATVANWLDELPNLYVELASRIGELGRQPYTARKFMIRYQNRVLFGTDGPWPEERLTYYWRFLETFDENFPYSEKVPPPQGLWNIYGVGLPNEVLAKIYCGNAMNLLPSVGATYQKAVAEMGSR